MKGSSLGESAEISSAKSLNFLVFFGIVIVPDQGSLFPVIRISPRDRTFGSSGLATSTMRENSSLVTVSHTLAEVSIASPDFTRRGPLSIPSLPGIRSRARLLPIIAHAI